MQHILQKAISAAEKGKLPDSCIRYGIRRLLAERLSMIHSPHGAQMATALQQFITTMHDAPIALLPQQANEQHYEVPSDFFKKILGEKLKYSSCYWDNSTKNINDAEIKSLQLSCQHAQIHDGMNILELGCGWGSLSLWMAEQYPTATITAVSNSHSQRSYIEQQAANRDLNNLNVVTADMNNFTTHNNHYDRVVSIEMFEHMRNWHVIFNKVSQWLKDDGKFFMHIFVHRDTAYPFEVHDASDWMTQHFFAGGMMPSDDLPLFFQQNLLIEQRWRWNGQHYSTTLNTWLATMDKQKKEILAIFNKTYGAEQAQQWWGRWRMFLMASAELFAYNRGETWYVNHYLFNKRTATMENKTC